MYTCASDGCPERGAAVMECKAGYVKDAPLCSLCEVGFAMQVRRCVECEEPQYWAAALLVVGLASFIAAAAALLRKNARFLESSNVFAHVKILVGFVTVVVTVNQFDVIWPAPFARVLDALSLLSFDLTALGTMFCLVRISFYQNILYTTMLLLSVAVAILLGFRACRQWERGVFITVYLLLFAYPVVAVKVVAAFACHDVEGVLYLKADYSVKCNTPQWYGMAAYCACWLAVYVLAFPLAILAILWSYRTDTGHHRRQHLGFLLRDYKRGPPMMLWEALEMCRKLVASVIGTFWSTRGVTCVATALLISTSFLLFHVSYYPYESTACNRLQTLCLTVLNLIYFACLLLKTDSVQVAM
jgi:hypothetical protein